MVYETGTVPVPRMSLKIWENNAKLTKSAIYMMGRALKAEENAISVGTKQMAYDLCESLQEFVEQQEAELSTARK